MAIVTIPAEARRITGLDAVKAYLADFQIHHEEWPLEDRVDPAAPAEQILAAYAPEIDELKARGGFVTADVIDVRPETPNLDAMLAKFSKEHTHSEDEVRFILQGRGVFHVHATGPDGTDTVFAIEVGAGDLISVPRDTKHWFDLCDDRRIRAIRLFQDTSGWTPHYVEGGVHGDYIPLCMGPAWVPASGGAGR